MATYTDFDQVRLMQRQRFEQVIDAFITETLVTVRSRTPIDTGTARSGWERFPPGTSIPGTTQWVFNNVPYIVPLEYGHSQQAPAGMARITAAESQARMDGIVARVVVP
jgi:hypothetical protein